MSKTVLKVGMVIIGTFVLMAITGLIYETINVENYSRVMSFSMKTATDAALNNNQTTSGSFDYNKSDYISFIDNVVTESSDFEMLKYIRPGYGISTYMNLGISPINLGVAYLDKEKLKEDFTKYIEIVMGFQGKTMVDGMVFDNTGYQYPGTVVSRIKNNGSIELLLDTVDVELEYKVFKRNNISDYEFLSKTLLGVTNLESLDTGDGFMSDVVVWKVTVRVKTVLPYGTYTSRLFLNSYGREVEQVYSIYYYFTR